MSDIKHEKFEQAVELAGEIGDFLKATCEPKDIPVNTAVGALILACVSLAKACEMPKDILVKAFQAGANIQYGRDEDDEDDEDNNTDNKTKHWYWTLNYLQDYTMKLITIIFAAVCLGLGLGVTKDITIIAPVLTFAGLGLIMFRKEVFAMYMQTEEVKSMVVKFTTNYVADRVIDNVGEILVQVHSKLDDEFKSAMEGTVTIEQKDIPKFASTVFENAFNKGIDFKTKDGATGTLKAASGMDAEQLIDILRKQARKHKANKDNE